MENKDIVVNEEKKYSNDAKKSYIILGVLASLNMYAFNSVVC